MTRNYAGVDEAVVLIMAMHSSNMPKFLVDDAVLFKAIVFDLFPAIEMPEHVRATSFSPSCPHVCSTQHHAS